MELSFCDLRAKMVVNLCDGQKLGNIIDLVIDCRTARVTGIVVPYERGFFSFFKMHHDIFIPWHRICKIGRDVILVDITPSTVANNVGKLKKGAYKMPEPYGFDLQHKNIYHASKNKHGQGPAAQHPYVTTPPTAPYQNPLPLNPASNPYQNSAGNNQYQSSHSNNFDNSHFPNDNYNNSHNTNPQQYTSPFFENNDFNSSNYSNLDTFRQYTSPEDNNEY